MVLVHVLFLPYRQNAQKLSEYIPQLRAADHSTLHKRIQKMEISLPHIEEKRDLIIALDSTGVKVTNRGEWIREEKADLASPQQELWLCRSCAAASPNLRFRKAKSVYKS